MSEAMLYEAYLRQQVDRGEFGVCIIPADIATGIAGYIEMHRNDATVVRCKDCRYGEPKENASHEAMVMCQNKQNPVGYDDWLVAPDWYCADGERRDGDDRVSV